MQFCFTMTSLNPQYEHNKLYIAINKHPNKPAIKFPVALGPGARGIGRYAYGKQRQIKIISIDEVNQRIAFKT